MSGTYRNAYPRDLADGRAAGIAAFFRYVYLWMAVSLGVTGLVSAYIMQDRELLVASSRYGMVPMLAGLGVVMYLSRSITQLQPFTASSLFLAYSALQGAALAPIFYMYTGESVSQAFFVTGGTFAATAGFGFFTKRDLSSAGRFAMIGLIGAIVASLANIFFRSEGIAAVLNYALVLIFAIMAAWDNQRLREAYAYNGAAGNLAIYGALVMYLNFMNLFLAILRITGSQRGNSRD
jgi:FtsH-binding integral membrane protein